MQSPCVCCPLPDGPFIPLHNGEWGYISSEAQASTRLSISRAFCCLSGNCPLTRRGRELWRCYHQEQGPKTSKLSPGPAEHMAAASSLTPVWPGPGCSSPDSQSSGSRYRPQDKGSGRRAPPLSLQDGRDLWLQAELPQIQDPRLQEAALGLLEVAEGLPRPKLELKHESNAK